MSTAIIKRSNLNKIAFPQIDGIDIKRALTVKEAINKQAKFETDYVVIEAAKSDDVATITTLISAGTTVNKNTLIVLFTEPDEEIETSTLDALRSLLENAKQCVVISKYDEGTDYNTVFDEAKLLHDNMNVVEKEKEPEHNEQNEQNEQDEQGREGDNRSDLEKTNDLSMLGSVSFENIKVSNEERLELEYQLKSLTEELRLAKGFIEKIVNNPELSEVSVGGAEAERLYEENDALRLQISTLESLRPQLDEYKKQVEELETAVNFERQSIEIWRTLFNKIYEYGQIMKKENVSYATKAKNALAREANMEETVNQYKGSQIELTTQITRLTETVARLTDDNAELKIDLNNAVETGQNLKKKIDDLDTMITTLNDEKKLLSIELNKASAEVARLSTYDIEVLKRQAADGGNVQELLENRLRETKEQVQQLDERNKGLSKELANSHKKVEQLQAEKRVLEGMLDGENYGARGIIWMRPVQARLMVFIGHGGQGCSSLVAGVAKGLADRGKTVVVIDCDFRAPKQHSILNVNPIIDYSIYAKLTSEMKSSLGKVLAIGLPIYEHLDKELIIAVDKTKNGQLDLLSGLVTCRSTSEISGMDFNALCVELASKYDYIIVDLGRAEGNGGIARQQQAFMSHANRKFVVTSNNMECVKSTLNRLIQARIDVDTIELVFDMIQERTDKGLDNLIRRVKRTYEIPMDKGMLGKVMPLKQNNSTIKQIVYSELGDEH